MTTLHPSESFVDRGETIISARYIQYEPAPVMFSAVAIPDEEGGFSAFALYHPGIISQGDTLDEVRANLAEAFVGMGEAMKKHGKPILRSRTPVVDVPANAEQLWIKVDV